MSVCVRVCVIDRWRACLLGGVPKTPSRSSYHTLHSWASLFATRTLGVNFLGVGTAPRDSSGLIMRLALLLASWSAAASGKQIVCETTVNVLHAFFEPPPRHARSLLSLIEPMCVVL